jgi:DNA (cytosine-5)-methyltransferase 1
LTIVYFDRILELLPTFFVMENVTGLVKMKSSREYLKGLLAKVEKLYHIDYEILNALDFGVPQFRERVFFVGIRKDKLHLPVAQDSLGNWFKFPVDQQYFGSAKKYDWPTISKFGSKISRPRNLPRQLCVESCLVSDSNLKKIANASEYFNLYVDEKFLKRIDEGETVRPSFKRLHRFRYSPTACYGNNEVHLHPYKNRRISVREALRIQGVAESYVLPGDLPLTKKFKMIGNGVPVPLAEAVAKALREYLLDHRVVSE